MTKTTRGVSSIIGLVLLLGMVAVMSVSLLLVGGDVMSSTEQRVEQERVEHSFLELSQEVASTSVSSDTPSSLPLNAGERGAIVHHDSAEYEIWTENYSNNDISDLGSGTIGTIEYESESGTKVALEGGGVFRETGTRTQVLSAPPISYEQDTDTFSFAAIDLVNSKSIKSGEIYVDKVDTHNNNRTYVKGEHLFIRIESEYCRGWEQYFAQQAGDTVVQDGCYDGGNDEGTVKVKLGYADMRNAFDAGVAVPNQSNFNAPQGNSPHGNIEMSEGNYQPITSTIDSFHSELAGSPGLTTDGTTPAGEYHVEEMNGSYTFDLSEGDAVVAVNKSVSPDQIDVTNCANGQHTLKVYAKGGFDFSNDIYPTCAEGTVDTIQFYGTNTSSVVFQDSSSKFRGLVYVASDGDAFDPENGNYQVEVGGAGNVDVQGAIIAHSVNIQSAANSIYLEGSERSNIDVIPPGHAPAPQLTYLNIATHKFDVKNT